MAGRGKTTFQKRQKEQIRLERRQQKAAKRLERKVLREGSPAESGDELSLGDSPADSRDELSPPTPAPE